VIDPRRVLGEVALLGGDGEPGEEGQPLIGHQRHDMALALNGPELEGQGGPQRVAHGNHPRAGQARGLGHRVQLQPHEAGHEEEQAATMRDELARRQRERARIGHGLDRGARPHRAFVVQAARQRCEPLGREELPDRGRTERHLLLLEGRADVVDGVVALAERDDQRVGGRLLGLGAGPARGDGEKGWGGVATKLMAHHPKGPGRVAEGPGHLVRGARLEEIRSERFVGALLGGLRFPEEALALR
jgi:hypothetical protein